MKPLTVVTAVLTLLILALPTGAVYGQTTPPLPPLSPNASVFATGLNNPRGLKLGPDGTLYVAEGGTGGATTTRGKCRQVPAPIGPYLGSPTGSRISRIDASGTRTTVASGFPSSQTAQGSGSLVSGVADIAFIGQTLYALSAGAGCSHGVSGTPNAVVRVNPDGSHTMIANLSAFLKAHPVAHPEADDFEPDGTFYSMIAQGGKLYIVEPNHGELDEVALNGTMRRVIDISASQGHVVPTAVAYRNGTFYVGNLAPFPVKHGTSMIYRITAAGKISVAVGGLAAVVGVAFDRQGQLYVLETSTVDNQAPVPGTGAVVRVTTGGGREVIASGLVFPSSMAFGSDGNLYVSNFGFGFPPGKGEIVRVNLQPANTGGGPASLPNTGQTGTGMVALFAAAVTLICAGASLSLLRRRTIKQGAPRPLHQG